MHLSRAATCALHALAHLATEGDGRRATERDIIRSGGMPRKFIGKILRALVRGGPFDRRLEGVCERATDAV
jgi:DNA-binding IscR family transcriptional regulator